MAELGARQTSSGRQRSTTRIGAVVIAMVLGVAGCGGGSKAPTTPGPPTLSVTPAAGRVGTVFHLRATAMKPGENVVFETADPSGTVSKTKTPRAVASDGSLTASFRSAGKPLGLYRVKAVGDKGESAGAIFEVLAEATTTTTVSGAPAATTTVPASTTLQP